MLSSNARPCAAFVAFIPLMVIPNFSSAHGADPSRAVRVIDAQLATTLRDSYSASPTMRALVDELEGSDVIVHVVSMGQRPQPLNGMLAFVHATNGRRILRIAINRWVGPKQRAAVLAHELQHAVEVARCASAIDEASFAGLYREIGYRVFNESSIRSFETDEARRIAERVSRELKQADDMSRSARESTAVRSR